MAIIKYVTGDGLTTLTLDDVKREIIDIDVDPNSDTVVFDRDVNTFRYSIVSYGVNLENVKKVFPNVKYLVFNASTFISYIPNAVFPNVKSVLYNNFQSTYFKERFYNAFCTDANAIYDMTDYKYICSKAFSGCKSTNLINTENIVNCDPNAFENSAFSEQPFVDGLKIAGTILFDVDYKCDEICIPDYVTCISDDVDLSKIKCLRIKNLEPKYVHKLNKSLAIDTIILDDSITDKDIDVCEDLFYGTTKYLRSCNNLVLSKNITTYTINDGIVYQNDGTELVMCVIGKSGDVIIPEGVESLSVGAFNNCDNIKSVTMPDSLIYFNDTNNKGYMYDNSFFYSCDKLQNINFGKNITTFATTKHTPIISYCSNIKHLSLPEKVKFIGGNMFMNMNGLTSIDFNKNSFSFGNNALNSCPNLKKLDFTGYKKITLTPSSCSLASFVKADSYIKNLLPATILTNSPRTPYNNKMSLEELVDEALVKYEINGKIFYIPKYLKYEYMDSLNKELLTKDCDDETIKSICENAYENAYECENEKKINLYAILYYYLNPTEKTKKYLKGKAKFIAKTLLEEGYIKLLIAFLDFNLISKKSLESLLELAKNDNVLYAYILNKFKALNSTTTRKFSL